MWELIAAIAFGFTVVMQLLGWICGVENAENIPKWHYCVALLLSFPAAVFIYGVMPQLLKRMLNHLVAILAILLLIWVLRHQLYLLGIVSNLIFLGLGVFCVVQVKNGTQSERLDSWITRWFASASTGKLDPSITNWFASNGLGALISGAVLFFGWCRWDSSEVCEMKLTPGNSIHQEQTV